MAGRNGGTRLRGMLAAHAGSLVESALAAELGDLSSLVEQRQEQGVQLSAQGQRLSVQGAQVQEVKLRLELLERQAEAAARKGPPGMPEYLQRFWDSQNWRFRKAVTVEEFMSGLLQWFDADRWVQGGQGQCVC